MEVINDIDYIPMTQMFNPRHSSNSVLYEKFAGKMLPRCKIEKAINLCDKKTIELESVYMAHKEVFDPRQGDYVYKPIIVAHGISDTALAQTFIRVEIITYGVVSAICKICNNRTEGADPSGWENMCVHELAVLILLDRRLDVEYTGKNLDIVGMLKSKTDALNAVSTIKDIPSSFCIDKDTPKTDENVVVSEEQQIIDILLKNKEILKDDRKLIAAIYDIFPNREREVNIISILIKEGITKEQLKENNKKAVKNKYVRILKDSYGIDSGISNSVVELFMCTVIEALFIAKL